MSRPFQKGVLYGGILLVVLTLLAYLPALQAGFIWDDDQHVTENEALRSLEGLGSVWLPWLHTTPQYYPLTFTVFWAAWQLWGAAPLGYHLLNIVLHAANVLLLWTVWRRYGLRGAWLAAALFAVHPLHVMSVAWITELKNVLCLFFLLSALLAYERYERRREQPNRRGPGRWSYGLALALFLCAMFSKTAAVVFPLAVVARSWWQRGRLGKRELMPLLPFIAVAVLGGGITWWIEQGPVGAAVDDYQPAWPERLALFGTSFWFYLSKYLWPIGLAFIYPWRPAGASLWSACLPTAGLVLLLLVLFRFRTRFGRGPFAALGYFALAGPVLPLVHVLYMMRYTPVANHWIYFAGPALLALLAEGLAALRARWTLSPRITFTVTVALLTILTGLTWRHLGLFQDEETLWTRTIRRQPDSWMAHNNLGVLYAERQAYVRAEHHYRAALQARPDYPNAYNNLGILLQAQGQLGEAQAMLETAVELAPLFLQAHYNLGRVLDDQSALTEAEQRYRYVLEQRPDFAAARQELAANLLHQGRAAEAASEYYTLLRAQPGNAVAHGNLGAALAHLGREEEAITALREALRLNPGFADAHNNLAGLLARRGETAEARAHFEQAAQLAPKDANIQYNLGLFLSEGGDREGAAEALRRALELRPQWSEARAALRHLGRPEAPSP